MRYLACCTVLVFLVCCASAAYAQGDREIEAFGGYSFADIASGSGASFPAGFAANASVSLIPRVSLEGDFGYHYKSVSGVTLPCLGSSGSICTDGPGSGVLFEALGGPRYTAHRGRTNLFVHGLVGVAFASVTAKAFGTASATGFAVGGGGGIDIGLSQHLAVQVIQADVLPSDLHGSWIWPINLSAGLVVRFNK